MTMRWGQTHWGAKPQEKEDTVSKHLAQDKDTEEAPATPDEQPENPNETPPPTTEAVPEPQPEVKQLLVAIDVKMWGMNEVKDRIMRAFGGHGVTFIDSVVAEAVEKANEEAAP